MSAPPPPRPALALAVVLASATTACGGDEATTYPLANGVEAEVTADGTLSLSLGGRPLWSTSAAARPTVRTFVEEPIGALGIWEFRRTMVEEAALGELESAEATADGGLVLRFAGGGRRGTLELEPDGADATRVRFAVEGDASSLALPGRCDDDGSFLGFGEQYGATDQRGERFPLLVSEQGIGRTGAPRVITGDAHTTYFPMPYYLDARGFGVLAVTARRVEVDLCASDPATAWIEVVDGRPLELVVLHGPTPTDVVRQLGDRVGRPATPPAWAFELWIGAQGGQDAVLAEVDALAAAEIPVGVIWSQDWTGARTNFDGGEGVEYRWEVDAERYPDLGGMVADLHARGLRFLAYVNPFVDPALPNHFDEMAAAGLLVRDADGAPYVHPAPNGQAAQPDLTLPAARDYVEAALGAIVDQHGVDGWMADFGEWLPLDAVLAEGDPRDLHNRYPIEWIRASRAVMDARRPDGDWVVFARSGWTGVHDVSQIHWVGDQETSFSPTDGLPTVVPAMINLGLSGIPFVTHDIAGFSSAEGPSDKELFLRWTELGAFTPFMRTHEGAMRDENWRWDADAETTTHFRRFARVHQALGDELRALAAEAGETGAPIVRHLVLEYPDDPAVVALADQYLLGPDLLVAPVLHRGVTEREVYLPVGRWHHVWTGEAHDGPGRITVAAPIGSPPVFARERDRPDLRAIDASPAP